MPRSAEARVELARIIVADLIESLEFTRVTTDLNLKRFISFNYTISLQHNEQSKKHYPGHAQGRSAKLMVPDNVFDCLLLM